MSDSNAGLGESARRTSSSGEDPSEEELAIRHYLMYFLLPFWIVPGFADWYWHRSTKIEETSGTFESLTHAGMMTVIGVPVLVSLLCEINALTISIGSAALLAHEAITVVDVAYAKKFREIPTVEQHTHSFLETIPLMALSFSICLDWQQFLSMFGKGKEKPRWRIRLKERLPTARYLAVIGAAITCGIAIPYAEELVRCLRTDPTLLPHRES